jgi:arylsulfatase A-like enzyme
MAARVISHLAAMTCTVTWLATSCLFAADSRRPNVVLILTDNEGAWTLGCYGNQDIRTPHIDRLAAEGMRFTRCFASNAVCSPTRATLLTGLIPSQHGVHCYLGAGGAQVGPGAYNTIQEFRSLPKILAECGYTCGLCGKWHLGDNLHPQEGFRYWVTMPHGNTTTFYGAEVIENGLVRKEPTYLTDFWTDHAVRFIEQNKQRPFFLYLPYNGPYGLGKSLLEPARNRHAAYYADKTLECFPRQTPHPWLFNNREYINNPVAMRRYAAEISGVDDGVGRVLDTLSRLGLDENTLLIFTADQGLNGGQNGIWGMGDHTRPLTAFDDQIRVPLIFRHPHRIPPGSQSDLMVSHYDLLPSVLSYLGLAEKLPREPPLPGHDYSPVLRGKTLDWDQVIFYEFENVRMIRTPQWKYIRRFPDGPHELYDLARDPGEQSNLAGRPEQAEIQRQLQQRQEAFFGRYAVAAYDLWKDGRSKSLLLSMPQRGAPARAPAAGGKQSARKE